MHKGGRVYIITQVEQQKMTESSLTGDDKGAVHAYGSFLISSYREGAYVFHRNRHVGTNGIKSVMCPAVIHIYLHHNK